VFGKKIEILVGILLKDLKDFNLKVVRFLSDTMYTKLGTQ